MNAKRRTSGIDETYSEKRSNPVTMEKASSRGHKIRFDWNWVATPRGVRNATKSSLQIAGWTQCSRQSAAPERTTQTMPGAIAQPAPRGTLTRSFARL